MLIESILRRDPPTEIVLGDTTYKFKPDDKGRHVAEVTDKHHVARLLSISEGYQLADGDEDKLPKAVKKEIDDQIEERNKAPGLIAPVDENVLAGSTVHPATLTIKGEQVSIDDVIFHAHEMSGMTTAEWNAMPEDARHDLIDAALNAMDDDENDPANPETPAESGGEGQQNDGGSQEADDKKKADAETKRQAKADEKAKAEDREAAAKEYKDKFGKLPHGRWDADKIRAELKKPADEGK